MKEWKVVFTAQSECDIRNIYEYIAFSLLEPTVAKKQIGRIIKAIEGLEALPMRCPVHAVEPWKNVGLRKILTDNFVILFLPDKQIGTVFIVRIMYGGRDIDTELTKEI